ncbi:CPBP family intramembrane glutamic endopeptidase [Clostridium sp.]|uniref:CPBP family intramembrane glutamic endopeptidase n=1 Tax=Clostridium sp. TaxID=1506 RepID=UPI001B7575E1|nr:CPBP family intramembrane glutamic endopeptidase [Clostridium sp.]MBP3917034.1 CPBP family intramembrane metalloprotease [Clostridium sp.]
MKEIKIWQMILIWGISIISSIFGILILGEVASINQDVLMNISDIWIGFTLFLLILIITLIFGRVNIKLIKERYSDFKNNVNIKEIISLVATQLLLSLGLSNLSTGIIAIIDKDKVLNMINDTSMLPTNNVELILCFISIVILAPVLEEITFRKVLFIRLSRKLGFVISAVISSLIFGIGHNSLGILGAIAFGIGCCILYRKYNNIAASITVHMVNNLISGIIVIIVYFTNTLPFETTIITNSDINMYLITGSIGTIIALIIFVRFILKNKHFISRKKREKLLV